MLAYSKAIMKYYVKEDDYMLTEGITRYTFALTYFTEYRNCKMEHDESGKTANFFSRTPRRYLYLAIHKLQPKVFQIA